MPIFQAQIFLSVASISKTDQISQVYKILKKTKSSAFKIYNYYQTSAIFTSFCCLKIA